MEQLMNAPIYQLFLYSLQPPTGRKSRITNHNRR
jgi:hypothetical protein